MKNRQPFRQALTFDDVLLVPRKSKILPSNPIPMNLVKGHKI